MLNDITLRARFLLFAVLEKKSIHQKHETTQKKLPFVLAMSLLAACDNDNGGDVIWDVVPVEFNIFITDADGHDLLDSTYQSNLLADLTVNYQQQTYPVMNEREAHEKMQSLTRAYMPFFYGLVLRRYWSSLTSTYEDYQLVFGEFDGTENVDRREIVLCHADGSQARLAYKNSFKWKSDGSPKISRQFYFDDKEVAGTYHLRYAEGKGFEYVADEEK